MASLHDPPVQKLLEQPNYAVVSTLNRDGSIHNTIVWISAEGDQVAINSAVGRLWPTNLQRDPRVTVVVQEDGNPYNWVEIRGTATGSTEDADEHIEALSQKYTGHEFADRRPGDQWIKFTIEPAHVRLYKTR